MAGEAPIHLVKGSDDVLLVSGALELIDSLVGERDRNEVLTEFSGDDYTMGDVLIAASTVSMFGARVVVARNAGRFVTEDVAPLVAYLADPAPDSTLVLVWERAVSPAVKLSPIPKKLADAIKSVGGEVHNFGVPGGKGRELWANEQMDSASVELSARARKVILERLGDDLNRLEGILTVLDATFGEGRLDPEDVEPYLGDAGAVPPWDLTDAIDKGDIAGSITNLHRLLGNGARHPLQVMVTLQTHVERMLRLDGSGVRDEKAAAGLLGMKGSTFPAKKALAQARKLGSERIARANVLVAAADVDVRGRTAISSEVVLETLVARLALLSRGTGGTGGAGGAAREGRAAREGARAGGRARRSPAR